MWRRRGRCPSWPFTTALMFIIALMLVELLMLLAGLWKPTPTVFRLDADVLQSAPLLLLPPAADKGVAPPSSPAGAAPPQPRCTHFSCLNVYGCGGAHRDVISVYIYPYQRFVDESGASLASWSREYAAVLQALRQSDFYTDDPELACVFVPSIDTMVNPLNWSLTRRALASLSWWRGSGENHLLFSAAAVGVSDTALGRSMLASAGLSAGQLRHGFDVALPTPSRPHSAGVWQRGADEDGGVFKTRRWLLLWAADDSRLVAPSILAAASEHLLQWRPHHPNARSQLLLLNSCSSAGGTAPPGHRGADQDDSPVLCNSSGERFSYLQALQDSEFCVLLRHDNNNSNETAGRVSRGVPARLLDSLASGCIPVLAVDGYPLPFSSVIDWTRLVLRLHGAQIDGLIDIVHDVSLKRRQELRRQGGWIYNQYFKSYQKMALTTIQIINDRMLPHRARSYEDWNDPPNLMSLDTPTPFAYTAPRQAGFTAVILTYDRLESLYTLVRRIAALPSLHTLLVVWNNQLKSPPEPSLWPHIGKPLKVIQTPSNVLSNRFYPYDEIETECVLSLDDDIDMLTEDELEFAYQTWREFPDRIVGFPPRNHVWNNISNSWAYQSEWTNDLSMVLTGAAFYHKYWHYRYTNYLPVGVKDWVDRNMNCEDIAMNFLVANVTGNAPIKVTSRKKFKCSSSGCSGGAGDISANQEHFVERSECVRQLAAAFGHMPLRPVEFRADPVLYRDQMPAAAKLYTNVDFL